MHSCTDTKKRTDTRNDIINQYILWQQIKIACYCSLHLNHGRTRIGKLSPCVLMYATRGRNERGQHVHLTNEVRDDRPGELPSRLCFTSNLSLRTFVLYGIPLYLHRKFEKKK
jgi:hypothetical protein